MAKENKIPSHIHTELALLELNSAVAMLRLIAKSETTASDFRACLPVLLNELNNATYYLRYIQNPPATNANALNDEQ